MFGFDLLGHVILCLDELMGWLVLGWLVCWSCSRTCDNCFDWMVSGGTCDTVC